MVNLASVMTKPYMLAGNLAKGCVCGTFDLIDDMCVGKNGKTGVGRFMDNVRNDGRDDSESHHPLNSNPFGGGLQGKNTKFLDYSWNRLPARCKNAAKTLGHDQSTWDFDGWSHSEEKWWEDLTSSEREAALTLGWDESAWDSNYDDKNWNQLPGQVQKAAGRIGYTQEMWDWDEEPYVFEKSWNEMTSDEQKAMHVLGYYEYCWE